MKIALTKTRREKKTYPYIRLQYKRENCEILFFLFKFNFFCSIYILARCVDMLTSFFFIRNLTIIIPRIN